jgi:hypothetical protein
MADSRLDVEKRGQYNHPAFRSQFEDDGPANPEPRNHVRLDGFARGRDRDIHPTVLVSGHEILDRTDRSGWPNIVEIDSPFGGTQRKPGDPDRLEYMNAGRAVNENDRELVGDDGGDESPDLAGRIKRQGKTNDGK